MPTNSEGTLYLMIEEGTGWFLDTPNPAVAQSFADASVSQSATAAATPEETEKTRTVDLMRVWAHDDDFNDVANWAFRSVELVGRSIDRSYLVRIDYESAEVGSIN